MIERGALGFDCGGYEHIREHTRRRKDCLHAYGKCAREAVRRRRMRRIQACPCDCLTG